MVNLVAALITATALAGTVNIESARPGVDVERYRFEIAVNDSNDVIVGRAHVGVRFTQSVDSFFLDLVGPATGATGMNVSEIRLGDQPARFRHAENRLIIETPETQTGDTRTYTIHYSGIPADGLIISTNKFGGRTFFGDNWPNRARHWLPTVDHVSDKAFVEWIVSMPDHYQAVANGELLDESTHENGIRITHWHTIAPIPTKVMVIGVARFAIQHRGLIDGVPVQTWVYPQDKQAGFRDFSVADSMLRYFVTHIGEFPYAKLANVQSTTRYGGMENAGAIFYSEQGITGRRRNEATVAHEIAHQWFGDSVTEADWHHIWLSEGFATYFANLYWEYAYGRESMEDRLRSERQTVVNYHRSNPNSPVVDLTITHLNNLLSPNSYQKGGWVLHMLRNEVGDETFWDGIRGYYQRFRDSNALTEDLRDVMEEASGMELDAFFEQWIYRAGQPNLFCEWSVDEESESLLLTVEQLQSDLFDFPLEIGFERASGEQMVEQVVEQVRVTERRQTFEIGFDRGALGSSIELDPNTNLLFEAVTRSVPGSGE